jgi:ketosteroid isomerase-like protein
VACRYASCATPAPHRSENPPFRPRAQRPAHRALGLLEASPQRERLVARLVAQPLQAGVSVATAAVAARDEQERSRWRGADYRFARKQTLGKLGLAAYSSRLSQESIDLSVATFEAWNRGDYEAWVRAFDSNCEFWPLRAQLEGHSYRGHAGLREFMRELTNEWEGVRFSLDEIRDRDDFVVARARFQARGRASGAELNIPIGVVAIVRAGKVVKVRMYSDPAEAFEVAGLQP